ncbi:MAG: flagellin lysine-N-methylase [Clostridia bacterium]|nr:flagellin lysine-N-methylase [Clostridia bacterium]
MHNVYPSYYKKFKCIASACKHNCCIGWEIDIDKLSYNRYMSTGGEMGERFLKEISRAEVPCFILGENERCPFLNCDNLCDIIINLGEDALCDICKAHPRFQNELPQRIETGIGLACEEAARIILSEREPTSLIGAGDTEDEILLLRERAFDILQNREKPIRERIFDMLLLCGAELPKKSIAEWADVFMSLERLDDSWTDILKLLYKKIDFEGFEKAISDFEYEYEQLCHYFIYRYFANAPDTYSAAVRAAFAALCTGMIYTLGAAIYTEKGALDFEERVELCRMFSSEIEYSEENVYNLLEKIEFP